MYSGWLLTNLSGNLIGAHQQVDRVARRYFRTLLPNSYFPSSRQILHFEGKNGPDGIKSKSPATDEPWHYYDPFDPDDSILTDLIDDHYQNLVEALKIHNSQRASFEAAWLAHAIVDGLTPAHHYPYEQELEKLRGESKDTRTSLKKKLIMPGETRLKMFVNNWKMWGAKGLFTTHGLYEMGVAAVMRTMRFNLCQPTEYDIRTMKKIGYSEYFKRQARAVAGFKMYEYYYEHGWNSRLARQTRDELVPILIRTVCLTWYAAARQAERD